MRATLLFTALVLAGTGCSSDPKVLNGRHRQPINTGVLVTSVASPAPVPVPAPVRPAPAVVEPAAAVVCPALPVAATAASRTFTVYFPYGNTTFKVGEPMAAEMLPLARGATVIRLRGRTDGQRYSVGDERVAMNRAIAARNYFVSRGIAADRIEMQYVSAADYAADNSTQAGRDLNRRVEIDLVQPAS